MGRVRGMGGRGMVRGTCAIGIVAGLFSGVWVEGPERGCGPAGNVRDAGLGLYGSRHLSEVVYRRLLEPMVRGTC